MRLKKSFLGPSMTVWGENMDKYVLQSTDCFGFEVYYGGDWHDTTFLECAKTYTLDEAMKESKRLERPGSHYKCVRLGSINGYMKRYKWI